MAIPLQPLLAPTGNPSSRNPKSVPIGRLATVHDIARVAAFLCSPVNTTSMQYISCASEYPNMCATCSFATSHNHPHAHHTPILSIFCTEARKRSFGRDHHRPSHRQKRENRRHTFSFHKTCHVMVFVRNTSDPPARQQAADYITGTVIDCDGGYKIGMVLPRL